MKTLEIAVVIPAYNEEKRLPETLCGLKEYLTQCDSRLISIKEVLIIDDGSTDNTVEVAEKNSQALPEFRVVSSQKNFGKGHAVHQGMKAAKSPWVLIADADMATPWKEMEKLAWPCQREGMDIAIASRDIEGSQLVVRQSFLRETLGKIFNRFVCFLMGFSFKDTQCGFKLFYQPNYASYMHLLKVNRFSWDVEFLLLAKKLKLNVKEVAVEWHHKEDSHVRLLKDGLDMLVQIVYIRMRYFFINIQEKK